SPTGGRPAPAAAPVRPRRAAPPRIRSGSARFRDVSDRLLLAWGRSPHPRWGRSPPPPGDLSLTVLVHYRTHAWMSARVGRSHGAARRIPWREAGGGRRRADRGSVSFAPHPRSARWGEVDSAGHG